MSSSYEDRKGNDRKRRASLTEESKLKFRKLAAIEDEPSFEPFQSLGQASKLKLEVFRSSWDNFCKDIGIEPEEKLFNPSVKCVESFLRWYIEGSGAVKCLTSVLNIWHCFSQYYFHISKGQSLEKTFLRHMSRFVRKTLQADYNLRANGKDKPELPFEDLREIIRYHWCQGRVIYKAERIRVQIAAFLLLVGHTGSRPGAIVESTSRPGSRKCLQYGDLSFFICQHERFTSVPFIIGVNVTFRFRKGDEMGRDPQQYTFYMKDDASTDVVLHLLALAFADDAFADFRSPEDILKIRMKPTQRMKLIDIHPEMSGIPVFRQMQKLASRGTSLESPWTGSQASLHIRRLSMDYGLPLPVTSYCIRRDVGNLLDQTASVATRNQIMGHKPVPGGNNVFEQSYWSRKVKHDVQAAASGTEPMQDFLRSIHSMAARRDERAPFVCPSGTRVNLEQDSEIRRLRQIAAEQRGLIMKQFGSVNKAAKTALGREYEQTKRRIATAKETLVRQRLKEERQTFWQDVDGKDFREQIHNLNGDFDSDSSKESSRDEERIGIRLGDIPPWRTNLLQRFYQSPPKRLQEEISLQSRLDVVAVLVETCQKRDRRPQKYSAFKRQSFASLEDAAEVEIDFKMPEGPLNRYCVFCLGDESLAASIRLRKFYDVGTARRHARQFHISRMKDEEFSSCPLPTCKGVKFDDKPHLLRHLDDCHDYRAIPKFKANPMLESSHTSSEDNQITFKASRYRPKLLKWKNGIKQSEKPHYQTEAPKASSDPGRAARFQKALEYLQEVCRYDSPDSSDASSDINKPSSDHSEDL